MEWNDLQKKKLQLLKKKTYWKGPLRKIYELQSYKDPKNQPNKSSLKLTTENDLYADTLYGNEYDLFQISLA